MKASKEKITQEVFEVKNMLSFGKRVAKEMSRMGLTGAQLAEKAKVDRTTVYRILSAKNASVSIETIEKISKALKTEPSALMF